MFALLIGYEDVGFSYKCFCLYNLQADLEEVGTLYLDAKSSARLLQEQQDRYIT